MTESKYLIWSVAHAAWWGPDYSGYTQVLAGAGRYGLDEATIICTNGNCAVRDANEVMMLAPEELPADVAVANRPGLIEDIEIRGTGR